MITLTIDGREIGAREGWTVLQAAQNVGIEIPTLCYHEALSSSGACRLCSVEITTKRGRNRVVTSCLYPVENGLDVQTNSEKIKRLRRGLMELLLARCPDSEKIKHVAGQMGVTEPRFRMEGEECILCGLCVRVCQEISEAKAISAVNRGIKKEIAPPFHDLAETCIGCGGCAYVCPTGAIKIEDNQIRLGSKIFKDLSPEEVKKMEEKFKSK
ncbi:MAG: 4Fe-4S dicluster domain-containing protein [Proteobacteria bacterium]|nr:4Fe-4S dicluster domain-containing protein [Pseudomonadota bacterium]NIS69621.1 4Fe-4S dicluster domain-containing protein [Pseudomonadota bacterium]